jgi:hypothetical protein
MFKKKKTSSIRKPYSYYNYFNFLEKNLYDKVHHKVNPKFKNDFFRI